MSSVPFYFSSIHGGLSSCAGLLHVNGDELRCEYRVDFGGMGVKFGAREAVIRLQEINCIEFKRGWFTARAMIRPISLKSLDRFPTSGDDSVLLYFKRKDRSMAEYLISEFSLRLSQSRLDF